MTSQPLPVTSYTAQRLEHATPEHLHQTTYRTFVGPIPEGWLKSHRKQWYRHYIGGPRGGRAPTFTAAHPVAARLSAPDNRAASEDRTDEVASASPVLSGPSTFPENTASTTSLLHSQHASPSQSPIVSVPSKDRSVGDNVGDTLGGPSKTSTFALGPPADVSTSRRVRFSEASKLQLRARAQRVAARGSLRSSKVEDGRMLKAEKMLVQVDITQESLIGEYDERASQGVVARNSDKWREYMIVCRKRSSEGADAVLQFYKTRVITASENDKVRKKPKIEILLNSKQTRINIFSALDKTLCIWTTGGSRTTIYYLRAQSGATAVEWYSFVRGILGFPRAQTLQVSIPDLSVNLRLDDPFRALESSQVLADAAEGNDAALLQAFNDEKGVAGAIVGRCIDMLRETPEWADVLRAWAHHERIGLAWKRYDRLEWVYGAVEQKMYGTMAMQRTHDLQLRPKIHYPDSTKLSDGSVVSEPPPVEGFLIRLTSQKGQDRNSMRRTLFKRLYFTSQSQFLLFLRPAKATPPPPPKLFAHKPSSVPSVREINDETPLTYDVDPFPLDGKQIAWLDSEGVKSMRGQETRDAEALDEAERNRKMLLAADGFVNLCDVKRIRRFRRESLPDDDAPDSGSDVDFHQHVADSPLEDGRTNALDEDRVFELVMKNGLVVRLQAYNKDARIAWVKRLRQLVTYWTQRIKADMDLYRSTRQQNTQQLGIDERAEALMGQFAHKWEVNTSFASPNLYNMCGISSCRPIHISGTLYRKPRRHTTFTRCHVILSHGHLIIFQDTLRKRTGKATEHIYHERVGAMSLEGCYLYSGLLTENDLLYQNQTFDSNMPGHHSLPRVYLEDGWTSTDEDAMTTFVIWHAKSKSWFKSSRYVDDVKKKEGAEAETGKVKTKLTRVSQLGTTGRSVVFKARSRAERDHWVMAIQVEIERMMAQNDEVRIVDED